MNTEHRAAVGARITLAADIVTAHVSHNTVSVADLPRLIEGVHEALAALGMAPAPEVARVPAVPIRASIRKDHLVCLEDGRKLKMLKRHLMAEHGLTPDQYRERWGLGAGYPMSAPDYAETRRDLARTAKLGHHARNRGPA